jgi:hypothetical protein
MSIVKASFINVIICTFNFPYCLAGCEAVIAIVGRGAVMATFKELAASEDITPDIVGLGVVIATLAIKLLWFNATAIKGFCVVMATAAFSEPENMIDPVIVGLGAVIATEAVLLAWDAVIAIVGLGAVIATLTCKEAITAAPPAKLSILQPPLTPQ